MSEPVHRDRPQSGAGALLALAMMVGVAAIFFVARAMRTSKSHASEANELREYALGYGLALALTCAAFAIVYLQALSWTSTFAVVLALAFCQAVVHFRYFLHLTLRRAARDDLQLILFSALIMMIMISGTLVILLNLRERMM